MGYETVASLYYANKKQFGKAALAALYNGYAEKAYDKEAAMEAFKEAERYGELVNDSLIIARAEYQMGKMLYGEYMHDEAREVLGLAVEHFGNRFSEKALAFNTIACCFMVIREYDSAAYYLEQSLKCAELAHSTMARNKTLNNYAVLYELKGDNERSIACLRMVEPENNEQRVLNYLNFYNVFEALGMTDSTTHYCAIMQELLEQSEVKTETRINVYKVFSEASGRNGQLEQALLFRKEYERLLGELLDIRSQKNVYRIQQKYDYVALQNTMNRKVLNRQRIIVVSSIIMVLLAIALTLSQRMVANKTRQEAQTKELLMYYLNQNYKLLDKQGKTMQKTAIVMGNKGDRMLLNELIHTVFEAKDPWIAMAEVLYSLHPEVRDNIERLRPVLTELELKDLLLSHFDVSRKDEALLLHINIHTLDKLRLTVKKKVSFYSK